MMAKILLVDDDQQIRSLIKLTLERSDNEVVEACEGNEAVEVFRREPFDLVITDIVMPGKEGIELIMDLKEIDPDVKIIAISGGGRIDPEDYLKWADRFGVACTFTKPLDRVELIAAIEKLVPAGNRN